MKLYLLISFYAVCMALANLCLKWASQHQGISYWLYFGAANIIGFASVIALPFALKLGPSQVVYACSIGGGFCLLQLTAFWIFKEPLTSIQWAGVVLVTLGMILLQWKPTAV